MTVHAIVNPAIPRIEPVSCCARRPFWSVMIPTYNCGRYLEETLRSVLCQDPGDEHMQIEVVDDCSTNDDAGETVRRIGKERVSFFRQPSNVGPPRNFTTCVERARGEWVHILHGDDSMLPGFYAAMRRQIEREPGISVICTRFLTMSENGVWFGLAPLEKENPGFIDDWPERIWVQNRTLFHAMVVNRAVYERLGGFHPALRHTNDWDMWKRMALSCRTWYDPHPWACYRIHRQSDSSILGLTGGNIADCRRSIEIAASYLGRKEAKTWSKAALQVTALTALRLAKQKLDANEFGAAWHQVRECLRTSRSPRVCTAVAGLFLWSLAQLVVRGPRKLIKAIRRRIARQ